MTSECVVFGNLNDGGYSRVELPGGRRKLRHRHTWERLRGQIPAGMYVLHTCDNRACSNIEHLFLGTQQTNMVDMAMKNRGTGVLSPEKVKEIRNLSRSGISNRDIAGRTGASEHVVGRILRGTRYAWVR